MSNSQPLVPFQGGMLAITAHALKRFRERGPKREAWASQDHMLYTIERLLAQAQKVNRPTSITRLINHGFTTETVWESSGWYFVVIEEDDISLLVTVMRK